MRLILSPIFSLFIHDSHVVKIPFNKNVSLSFTFEKINLLISIVKNFYKITTLAI